MWCTEPEGRPAMLAESYFNPFSVCGSGALSLRALLVQLRPKSPPSVRSSRAALCVCVSPSLYNNTISGLCS